MGDNYFRMYGWNYFPSYAHIEYSIINIELGTFFRKKWYSMRFNYKIIARKHCWIVFDTKKVREINWTTTKIHEIKFVLNSLVVNRPISCGDWFHVFAFNALHWMEMATRKTQSLFLKPYFFGFFATAEHTICGQSKSLVPFKNQNNRKNIWKRENAKK